VPYIGLAVAMVPEAAEARKRVDVGKLWRVDNALEDADGLVWAR
jgi:hypothetical protein